jgi:RNA polymerase sigma factor for flagellar operon FliA
MEWHALVLKNMPLVSQIANRMKATLPMHISRDELKSHGYVGLCEAARRFHPSRGASFETYARTRIRGSIIDGLRAADHIPRSARAAAKNAGLEHELPELMSIDDTGVNEEMPFRDILRDTRLDAAARVGFRELPGICKILSDREYTIVDMKYRGGHTFATIGEVLGVSESRVCQLHRDLIARLREYALEVGGRDDAGEFGGGSRGGAGNGERSRGRACQAQVGGSRRRIQA